MTGAKWEKLEKVTRQQCAGEGLAKKRQEPRIQGKGNSPPPPTPKCGFCYKSRTWCSLVCCVCCWSSYLLLGSFSEFFGFPPFTKTNNSKFQFQSQWIEEPLALRISTAIPLHSFSFFICFYVLFSICLFQNPVNQSWKVD